MVTLVWARNTRVSYVSYSRTFSVTIVEINDVSMPVFTSRTVVKKVRLLAELY